MLSGLAVGAFANFFLAGNPGLIGLGMGVDAFDRMNIKK